ncbi:hypothetical protein SNEBB_008282 [Seison nebaliae]|nr:hypothetical protein SNEBB_008282 [Seison nebaliae]
MPENPKQSALQIAYNSADELGILQSDLTNDYDIISKVGGGTYGDVFKAEEKKTGKLIAIKSIKLEPTDDFSVIHQEVVMMKNCDHENIVGYYATYLRKEKFLICMEFCGGGSMQDIYHIIGPLNENQIAYVIRECLKGIKYLHDHQKIHRDIKGANVLLTNDGHVKLADFGVSAHITNTINKRKSFIGTPYWMAPEVAAVERKGGYNHMCDIWAIGITAIEFAELKPPLFDLQPMKALLIMSRSNYKSPQLRDKNRWSLPFQSFIKNSLIKNPKKRSNSDKLLLHIFIKLRAKLDHQIGSELLRMANDPNYLRTVRNEPEQLLSVRFNKEMTQYTSGDDRTLKKEMKLMDDRKFLLRILTPKQTVSTTQISHNHHQSIQSSSSSSSGGGICENKNDHILTETNELNNSRLSDNPDNQPSKMITRSNDEKNDQNRKNRMENIQNLLSSKMQNMKSKLFDHKILNDYHLSKIDESNGDIDDHEIVMDSDEDEDEEEDYVDEDGNKKKIKENSTNSSFQKIMKEKRLVPKRIVNRLKPKLRLRSINESESNDEKFQEESNTLKNGKFLPSGKPSSNNEYDCSINVRDDGLCGKRCDVVQNEKRILTMSDIESDDDTCSTLAFQQQQRQNVDIEEKFVELSLNNNGTVKADMNLEKMKNEKITENKTMSPSTCNGIPPTPQVLMGACFTKIFDECPLRVNCAISWIHPTIRDQLIIFGCDEGIYILNLNKLHENSLECLLPKSTYWMHMIVDQSVLITLSGRNRCLYKHDMILLYEQHLHSFGLNSSQSTSHNLMHKSLPLALLSSDNKVIKALSKRLNSSNPTQKISIQSYNKFHNSIDKSSNLSLKHVRRCCVARHPINCHKYLCAVTNNCFFLLQWYDMAKTFLPLKQIACDERIDADDFNIFEALISRREPYPFICLGLSQSNDRSQLKLINFYFNASDENDDYEENENESTVLSLEQSSFNQGNYVKEYSRLNRSDSSVSDSWRIVRVVHLSQLEMDLLLVAYEQWVQFINIDGTPIRRTEYRVPILQFEFPIDTIVPLSDSVLAFHDYGMQGKSFKNGEITQDILDPSQEHRVLGKDKAIVLQKQRQINTFETSFEESCPVNLYIVTGHRDTLEELDNSNRSSTQIKLPINLNKTSETTPIEDMPKPLRLLSEQSLPLNDEKTVKISNSLKFIDLNQTENYLNNNEIDHVSDKYDTIYFNTEISNENNKTTTTTKLSPTISFNNHEKSHLPVSAEKPVADNRPNRPPKRPPPPRTTIHGERKSVVIDTIKLNNNMSSSSYAPTILPYDLISEHSIQQSHNELRNKLANFRRVLREPLIDNSSRI